MGTMQINPGNTVRDPESSYKQAIFSGGVFGNHFAILDYQKDAVRSYLQDHQLLYPPEIWNSTGRARRLPDLSANGYVIVLVSHIWQISILFLILVVLIMLLSRLSAE